MDHTTPTRGNFVFGIVLVAVFAAVVWWRSSGSSVPDDIPAAELAAFSAGHTLDEAFAASRESGRPVFVYATASWCGPCRVFKSETLSQPEVAELLSGSFEAVYLDIDKDPRARQRLRVSSVPTLMVFVDGVEVERRVGGMPAGDFLAFLRKTLPTAASPGE